MMFESSDKNAALIRALAEVVPRPMANSLTYEIYRRMPNDTDLSITKEAGVAGLNFGYVDDFYYPDADTAETFWVSTDEAPDAFTRGLLSDEPEAEPLERILPGATSTMWQAPARTVPLLPPEVEVLADDNSIVFMLECQAR